MYFGTGQDGTDNPEGDPNLVLFFLILLLFCLFYFVIVFFLDQIRLNQLLINQIGFVRQTTGSCTPYLKS